MSEPTAEEVHWPELHRVRRTVMVVDVVESVRIMQKHEADFIDRWRRLVQRVRDGVLLHHHGELVRSLGDGLLLAFDDGPHAVAAAHDILQLLPAFNEARDADALIRLRVGINDCELVADGLDIYGAGVNLAARLATVAEPDQVVMSDSVNEQLHPQLDMATEDLGEVWLKHIDQPARVFCLRADIGPGHLSMPESPAEHALRPAIAVIPFATTGTPLAGVALGELIADELICALSALPDVRMVSRLSTTLVSQRGQTAEAVGATLQADFVLLGSCRVMGERVLVHAQLYDVRRATVLAHSRHSAEVASLMADDSPLIAALMSEMGSCILERQIELARRSAMPHLAGYTLLLGGIALMHRLSRHDFARARELLLHLSERWPRLPAPHAWLARWHLFNVIQGWSAAPAADRQAADQSCQRALDLDSESSVALAVAGSVQIQLAQNVDAGLALYDRAITVNPSDSFAWTLLGTAHAFKGQGTQATAASGQALRLSPLDPMHFLYDCHAASAALADGDYPRALALAQRSMRSNSQHLSTHRVLTIAQVLSGDLPAAQATVRRMRVLDPKYSVATWLRQSPSAAYPIGQHFARLLGEAGLPEN